MVSTLTGKAKARVSKKDAYCEAFEQLRRDGAVNTTDVSIKATW